MNDSDSISLIKYFDIQFKYFLNVLLTLQLRKEKKINIL